MSLVFHGEGVGERVFVCVPLEASLTAQVTHNTGAAPYLVCCGDCRCWGDCRCYY